ncbi:hypothetical protein AHAS_Ahas05G0234600 [Arachis hypogaea]
MAVVTEQDMKWRRERNKLRQQQVPSMTQTTSCKSTISSLILSSFSNETATNKNKSTFRGLGCTAASASSQVVSVPARPPPYLGRRTMNTGFSFLDDDQGIFVTRPGSESFAAGRYYRHVPHPSSDGLAEIMILQGRLLMGGRLNSHDQFRDWRLDVDNMSYEQLLELGERIGHVNTGLKEDEMGHNIRKIKHVISNNHSKHQIDKKCSICQEEYEADDEIGRLTCEHKYHFQCIKQWLVHKNFCPVCKQEVVVRHGVAQF